MGESVETTLASDPPFHALIDAIALGMAFRILVPPDGTSRRFVHVSESCQALNGVAPEAVLADAEALYGLVLPEHRARMQAVEAAALAARAPFDIEAPFRRPDGEIRWHRITSSPRLMEDGSTLWDGVQIDITAAKRAESELEEQRRRIALAVEATGLGFWEWSLRDDRLKLSERTRQLMGLPEAGEVDMAAYLSGVHPEDRDKVDACCLAAREKTDGGDFSIEYRVVGSQGVRWLLCHGRVVADAEGPAAAVGTTLDITARRAAEEAHELMLGELAHRAKNGLAIVMGLVQQTARGASTLQGFEALLLARLQAMADAQNLITHAGGRPAGLLALVQAGLKPFDPRRFELDPQLAPVRLSNDLALGVALLMHEMATNALKYGALSNADGRVILERLDAPQGLVRLAWRERGGPPVKPSNARGFGLRLLQAALRNQGGKVEAKFDPSGFEAVLEFPGGA